MTETDPHARVDALIERIAEAIRVASEGSRGADDADMPKYREMAKAAIAEFCRRVHSYSN